MAVVVKEMQKVDAKAAGKRAVRGEEGAPKKGEPGYSPKYVETPATPAYEYPEAKVTFLEGDSDGSETFKAVFDELFKGDFKFLIKSTIKGWNYFSKHNSAPKNDAVQLKALRVIAESTGLSLEDLKAQLGLA